LREELTQMKLEGPEHFLRRTGRKDTWIKKLNHYCIEEAYCPKPLLCLNSSGTVSKVSIPDVFHRKELLESLIVEGGFTMGILLLRRHLSSVFAKNQVIKRAEDWKCTPSRSAVPKISNKILRQPRTHDTAGKDTVSALNFKGRIN